MWLVLWPLLVVVGVLLILCNASKKARNGGRTVTCLVAENGVPERPQREKHGSRSQNRYRPDVGTQKSPDIAKEFLPEIEIY